MSTTGKSEGEKPKGSTQTIRLNLSSDATKRSFSTAAPPPKRQCFHPEPVAPPTASVAENTVLHQVTSLHFMLDQPLGGAESKWYGRGTTSLYLTSDSHVEQANRVSLALHLRACQINEVRVESMSKNGLQPLHTTFSHFDPLEHVLIKPPTSYTDAEDQTWRFNADAQSSRGAVGMTTGLRAASIASNMGELRISCAVPTFPISGSAEQLWKAELSTQHSSEGETVVRLRENLAQRLQNRREKRIDLVAQRLATAMGSTKGNRSFKVTVEYTIPLPDSINHLGGIHALITNNTPHIYTTTGVQGDHEGTRCWLPCIDSASCKHRSTHELVVKVTAPYRQGLLCIGAGQDFGSSETLLHDVILDSPQLEMVKRELGSSITSMLQIRRGTVSQQAHLIPPETSTDLKITSIDTLLATNVWCSHIWAPVPARSLGFAIGPFEIIEDPEYFGASILEGIEKNDDDDDKEEKEENVEERLYEVIESARRNGEGIRQAYFAPFFARRFLHQFANLTLIPDVALQLVPLRPEQNTKSLETKNVVLHATTGVPHRALSMTRDVLAIPTFPSAAYTQIWIPGAIHGGCSSGSLHSCPEVLLNPFLGGAIMDSRLLAPARSRLPYYQGGRVLQFLQARSVLRGWVTAALPLGGNDDVGMGYLPSLIESLIMSLYERGHGAHGEGGASGGVFYSSRYSMLSGLNSPNLDFLPVQNIEDIDVVVEGVGAVPVEDRHNEQLWRAAINGTESHTSGMDEFNVRQLLTRDLLEAMERGTDKDKGVPLPSMGWFGSHLSLTFLSSNASSSSDMGCGAVDMMHPLGGLVYRRVKSDALRCVVEGRAGIANFIRVVRAAFMASYLDDIGQTELTLPTSKEKKTEMVFNSSDPPPVASEASSIPHQAFALCVNEILKKKGLTHNLFTRALRNLCGRVKEHQLMGTQVDVERHAQDPRTHGPFVDPEGFPNSFVRGASMFYCKVGVHVEAARDVVTWDQDTALTKGIQLQTYAEPVIPEGGTAYGGQITIRVVENEGHFREYVKELSTDGSRKDWGTSFLHAKPVTTSKAQVAAGGEKAGPGSSSVFTDTQFHRGGYQAIELIRLTNLTPLLWVRVDPMGLYGGKITVLQPDACLAEQLYHDGDAGAQVDALRALAERPLPIRVPSKTKTIYDVSVSELPVRIMADCLRGSTAIHSSLPHTPTIRSQAALCIAQWQNNKAPPLGSNTSIDHWTGLALLLQYFRERFFSHDTIMPMKFSRLVLRTGEVSLQQAPTTGDAVASATKSTEEEVYRYLDSLEEGEEREDAFDDAEDVEIEEDEEYRVRAAVVTAIACIRAKDGLTPSRSIEMLATVLESEDAEMVGHLVYPDEELMERKKAEKVREESSIIEGKRDHEEVTASEYRKAPSLSYISSMLMADALLSLSHINARPPLITDPATGKTIEASGAHPLERIITAARNWIDWELYRERIRSELAREDGSGFSGNCYDVISSCAIVSLANLTILKQCSSTTSQVNHIAQIDISSADFYLSIFDSKPLRNDLTRAACAQATVCICCASDRLDSQSEPLGLLIGLEHLLDRILDPCTSPELRQTLSLIMMDACTGKVCSMQRVGAIGGRNDLVACGSRFFNGPLGASHGGDNGSAMLMDVAGGYLPAARAVNDGARRGLRLIGRAGHPKEKVTEAVIVRVAIFATKLWRTLNGEIAEPPKDSANTPVNRGVCAFDGILRCSLLALWQWIWPRGCYAVLQVQSWRSRESEERYFNLGAHKVMKISEEEKAAATAEEASLEDINRFVNTELDRQAWRGEMVKKAFDINKLSKGSADAAATEQGIGQPLPPVERDAAFRQGGWIVSAAKQRRVLGLDGGTVVTKLRLKVKSANED